MKIEILGVGCKNCEKLYKHALEAAKSAGVGEEAPVTKIEDIDRFMKLGVMTTPALVIDDKVVSVGRVLNVRQIQEKIEEVQRAK
jgi:small redox-active disulfide protein 2